MEICGHFTHVNGFVVNGPCHFFLIQDFNFIGTPTNLFRKWTIVFGKWLIAFRNWLLFSWIELLCSGIEYCVQELNYCVQELNYCVWEFTNVLRKLNYFVQELNVFGPLNTPSPDLRRDLIPEPEPTSGCLQFLMRKKRGPNNSG